MKFCFWFLYAVIILSIITASSASAPARVRYARLNIEETANCTTTPPKNIARSMYIWPEWEKKAHYWGYRGNGWMNNGWKKYKTYRGRGWDGNKGLMYCHGTTPETESITYAWPTWDYTSKEEWFYPLQILETKAGVLVAHGGFANWTALLLNHQEVMRNVTTINQIYPEEKSKPEIILVIADWPKHFPGAYDINPYYVVDVGVTPPFISNTPMVIGGPDPDMPQKDYKGIDKRLPYAANIKIEKIDADTYIFSGWAYGLDENNKDKDGKPFHIRYKYDRETRTVTKM